jgi:predicted DNA-binding transcriptional regulator AlpA
VNKGMVNRIQPETVPHATGTIDCVSAASRLLTPEVVAETTGLSAETLAQWRSQGKGPPYVKISRNCVRYRQSDLDGWVAGRIVRTDQDSSDRR